MASSGKQLNVKMNFQIDTTQAQQQLKGLYSQLNQITSASAFGKNSQLGITQEIMQATKAAAQLKTAITEAVNPLTGNLDLTKFNDQLRMSGMSLNQYREQLASLGTTGNQAFNQLTRSIATAETPLLRTSKAAQTMWTVLGNTVRWQATSSLLHGILSTASQAMGYVKSLDSSLNNIRIVTGQSQEQMARFAKTANQAAKELNTSTNEYAKASLIYYQQGLSNKQVEERTRTTIKLANVAGQSAKTVSDQMTAVWNNFYNGSKSIEYYADVITALGASTASSSEEIAKGLQKFSSIAETTGLSYEYATSALATVVATTRQSADSVGTSFKTLFSRLQSLNLGETLDDGTTLNKYSKALETIGVSIKKANGDLKDMDDILADLGSKWQSLGKDQQIALAQTVGGVRNYTGLVALMDNWDKFQENLKTAQTAQGTLQNQADIYAESWQAASAHVKAASETIYKNLLDDKVFKGLTNGFGSVLDIIGSLTDSLGGFGGTMMGLLAIGSKVFAPQMSNMFTNIGMNLSGRSAAIKTQQNAIAALKEPVTISQYASANILQNQINDNLKDNIIAQKTAIETGKMPTYMQPAYNMLMNTVDQQGILAVQATERVEELQSQRQFDNIMAQARLNAAGRGKTFEYTQKAQQAEKAWSDYLLKTPSSQFSAQESVRLLNEANFWKDMSGGAMPLIRSEETQARDLLMETYGAQQLQKAFGGTNIDISKGLNETQMKTAIGYIDRVMAGVTTTDKNGNRQVDMKALEQVYGRNAKAVAAFNEEVIKLGPNAKLIEGNLKILNDTLGVGGTSGLLWDLQEQLGESETSLGNSFANVMETIQKRVAAQYGEEVNGRQTRAYMANLESRLGTGVKEEFDKIYATGGWKAAQDYLSKQLGLLNEGTVKISGGQAATQITQAFAGIGTAVISGANAIKTLGDESATAGQKASALVTAMGTMPMAISSTSKIIKDWNTQIGTTSLTMGKASLAALGITTAIIGISTAIKEAKKASISGSIEALTQSIATSQQLASDAKEKYDNLFTLKDTHNNLLDNLKELKVGTSEFTNALLIANDTAQELIKNYDLIYGEDYTYGRYGEINFQPDSLKRVEKDILETKEERQIGLQQLRLAQKSLDAFQSGISDLTKIGPMYNFGQKDNQMYGRTEPINQNLGGLIALLGQKATGQGSSMMGTNGQQYDTITDYLAAVQRGEAELNGIDFSLLENQQKLIAMTGTSSIDETMNKLAAAGEIQKNAIQQSIEDAQAYSNATMQIATLFNSEAYNSIKANGQEAIALALQSIGYEGQNGDLINYAISSNPDFVASMIQLYQKSVQAGGVKNFGEEALGIQLWGESPRDWYRQVYGQYAESSLSDEEVESLVQQKLINDILVNGSDYYSNLELAGSSLSGGINKILQDFENIELPNMQNLTYNQIDEVFDNLKDLVSDSSVSEYGIKVYANTKKNETVDEYRAYTKQLFDNQIEDLQEAILQSYSDSAFDYINADIYDKEGVKNIADSLLDGLTYGTAKSVVNAMTQANSIAIGENMRHLLEQGKAEGNLTNILAAVREYEFDNSISSLYANSQRRKYARTQEQRDTYQNLLAAQIKEMEQEKGFFMALYNSSGFSDVMDALSEQFQHTGEITAKNISDLAEKSEVLSQALKFSADNADKLTVNSGGLADIFNEINKGTLAATDVTSGLVSALSIANTNESQTEAAFDIIDNLDLGRNATELMGYFQDMGKAFFSVENAGWGFYSTPMQNIIKMIGGKDVQETYREINAAGTYNVQDAIDQLPDYFVDFLYSVAGISGKGKNKKAKGGGGPADIFSFLYEAFSANGEDVNSNEFWQSLGFKTDAEGNLTLWDDYTTPLTRDALESKLAEKLKDIGISEEYAKDLATVIWSYGASSAGIGYQLDLNEAQLGFDELTRKGRKTPQGEKALRAFYNTQGEFLVDKNGKPLYETYDKFLEAYTASGGQTGWSATSVDDWAKISNIQNLATQAGFDNTFEGFLDLAKFYNAYNEDLQLLDWNKLNDMIVSMNGTSEDLISILQNSQKDLQQRGIGVVAIDKYGNPWKMTEDQTFRQFNTNINGATGLEGKITRGQESMEQRARTAMENRPMGAVGFTIDKDGNIQWQFTTEQYEVDKENGQQEIENETVAQENEKERFENTGILRGKTRALTPEVVTSQEAAAQKAAEEATAQEAANEAAKNNFTKDAIRLYPSLLKRNQEGAIDFLAQQQKDLETTQKATEEIITEEATITNDKFIKPTFENIGKTILDVFSGETAEKTAEDIWDTASEDYEQAFESASQYTSPQEKNVVEPGRVRGQYELQVNQPTIETPTNQIARLLEAGNKIGKSIVDNTGLTAKNTGEALDIAETNVEDQIQAKLTGKQQLSQGITNGKEIVLPSNQEPIVIDYSGYSFTPKPESDKGSDKVKMPSLSKLADAFKTAQEAIEITGKAITNLNTSIEAGKTKAGKASGQNNHTLGFASGKEGQIAVTGELGPELRIKSDGSAELLGKTGREYTWVDPDDRIYTATQTTSILNNNNIPALEGLAKGIQNYIPGYASSFASRVSSGASLGGRYAVSTQKINGSWGPVADWGGSSSGGGGGSSGGEEEWKDPRYDPNTLKIRDILERYYTILQQLNVIAHAVEHISKVVDRGWGQERIKALQEQTALYRKQYEAQVKYVQEIRSYTKTDKEALTTMVREFVEGYNEGKSETDRLTWNGAQFDENGVLTNYKDFVEKLVEQYNENAEENAGDKEAQYKFQEQLKDIQFYTESLNLLMTEEEKLYDLQNQILDNSVREITYRVEYENELDNNQLRLINYQFSKVKDDAYEAASAIDLLAQKSDYAQKSLNRYEEGFFDILGVYSNPELVKNMKQDFFDNPEKFFEEWSKYENNLNFQDITTEHAQLIEQYMDGMVSNLQELRSNFQQTVSMMGDNIKEFGKILDSEISKFDYYADVQKSLKNIIGLTNRNMTNIDSAFLAGLNSMQYDNAMNKVTANRRRVAIASTQQRDAQAMYDEMMAKVRAATSEQERLEWQQAADNAKKVLDTANEQFQNANKELLSSIEDTMQKIQDIYKEAIEEASRNFEASLSPYYKSLDLIQSSFDRQQKLSELYVKDYQRIHDLSKLNRDIEQSVLDTDNLKSKSRLRELQKQINKLQEDGTELSEYDLDLLDKKYRLELARQALEDAKDAKSVVRLSRDNNGNWGYAYSANTDDIEKRKQDYEDILRETEEANENAMTNYENQLMSIIQEYQQAVSSLDALNLSEEDRTNAMNEIRTFYQGQLDFIKSQMSEVTKNNLYLDPYILDRYGVNEHNLTTDFNKTILAKVLGIDSLDLMASTIQDSFDTLFNGALTAMADATSQQREALENAGLNPDDLAGSVGAIYKIIAEQSSEQVKVVEESADRIDKAFAETTKEIEKQIAGMDELIKRYEHFETVLEKITKFLELSGEFVPAEKLDFFDLIDSEEELKKIEDSLAKYKSIHVNEVNAEGNQIGYDLTEGSQATIDQIAKWRDAIYRKNAIDVGEAVDTRDELNKINEYLDAHGQAYVNINGELVHLVSGTEETNRLLAEWLAYIEQLEKPKPVNNNSSSGIGQWYNSDGTPIVWGGSWYTAGVSAGAYKESLRKFYSGGYTGRWQSALSGMYTGEWPMGSVESNGRWALLHQKELVLNAHDTENFLNAMEIVRQLDNLTNWMANGLGNLVMPNVTTERESLDQNVHIEANFPNVQNHNEIEQAFENIVNLASQYANRK